MKCRASAAAPRRRLPAMQRDAVGLLRIVEAQASDLVRLRRALLSAQTVAAQRLQVIHARMVAGLEWVRSIVLERDQADFKTRLAMLLSGRAGDGLANAWAWQSDWPGRPVTGKRISPCYRRSTPSADGRTRARRWQNFWLSLSDCMDCLITCDCRVGESSGIGSAWLSAFRGSWVAWR